MNIEKLLQSNKKRVTKERINIYNFLKTKHIFKYNDISLGFSNIGRSSIFRTLNLFLDLGVIRKIDVGENAITYELNDEEHHHEHMKCEKCDKIISFYSDNICKKIFEEANLLGFKIKSHNIGITGTCNKCL